MKLRIILYGVLALVLGLVWYFSRPAIQTDGNSSVKIALRAVGHELLTAYNDNTSRVLPVTAKGNNTYHLSWEDALSIYPGTLIETVDKNFKAQNLPLDYRVEVIQCADGEVAYSYQMEKGVDKAIIPCASRSLPEACYLARVDFLEPISEDPKSASFPWYGYLIVLIVAGSTFEIINRKSPQLNEIESQDELYKVIGNYKFYPQQHKLIRENYNQCVVQNALLRSILGV